MLKWDTFLKKLMVLGTILSLCSLTSKKVPKSSAQNWRKSSFLSKAVMVPELNEKETSLKAHTLRDHDGVGGQGGGVG